MDASRDIPREIFDIDLCSTPRPLDRPIELVPLFAPGRNSASPNGARGCPATSPSKLERADR